MGIFAVPDRIRDVEIFTGRLRFSDLAQEPYSRLAQFQTPERVGKAAQLAQHPAIGQQDVIKTIEVFAQELSGDADHRDPVFSTDFYAPAIRSLTFHSRDARAIDVEPIFEPTTCHQVAKYRLREWGANDIGVTTKEHAGG
jgi:hypothetical protein